MEHDADKAVSVKVVRTIMGGVVNYWFCLACSNIQVDTIIFSTCRESIFDRMAKKFICDDASSNSISNSGFRTS